MKNKYYSLKNILDYKAVYNMIIGERSNGKTTAVLLHGIKNYADSGKQMGIIRRWQDDFTGKRGMTMFNAVVSAGYISKYTGGKWTDVFYQGSKWFFCKTDDDSGKRIIDDRPFCYGFSISSMEHDKSTAYPDITTILFDEFITRSVYLPDEFVLFMNVLSTIIRQRTDVKIFMCGNTVNKYCPYFKEMGISHIKEMKEGSIDIYRYGDSDLTVAVEYCKPNKEGKESDFYFAFDNPKLSMITGGSWEIDIYPHCPVKYKPKDIIFTYFIIFDGDMLQCEIVSTGDHNFTFIHRKTTPLQDPDHDLVYSLEYSSKPNWKRNIRKTVTAVDKKIASYFVKEKVFYQDNEVGEIIRNYLQWCGKQYT